MVRTIAINGHSTKLIVPTTPTNRRSAKSIVPTNPTNRRSAKNQLSRQSQPIDGLLNQLSRQFQLIDNILNQLSGQFQSIDKSPAETIAVARTIAIPYLGYVKKKKNFFFFVRPAGSGGGRLCSVQLWTDIKGPSRGININRKPTAQHITPRVAMHGTRQERLRAVLLRV